MHMVGHDNPSQQAILHTIPLEKRRLHGAGDAFATQYTGAMAGIEVTLYALMPPGGVGHFEQSLPLVTALGGETVVKTESHSLHQPRGSRCGK